jgi:hypothetical protein
VHKADFYLESNKMADSILYVSLVSHLRPLTSNPCLSVSSPQDGCMRTGWSRTGTRWDVWGRGCGSGPCVWTAQTQRQTRTTTQPPAKPGPDQNASPAPPPTPHAKECPPTAASASCPTVSSSESSPRVPKPWTHTGQVKRRSSHTGHLYNVVVYI